MGGGGGLLGGVNEALFGDGGAEASQNAALAKQSEARRQFAATEKRLSAAGSELDSSLNQAGSEFNKATVASLMGLERDIKNQEKNLSRQEQLISQIDPTIIEASQQALRLLRGEQASTLGPLKNQRDQQRQRLLNTLREQLGPGAETSTAGIQALTRFDSETDNLFAGAQQQALSSLGALSGQFSAQRPDMFREVMGLSSLGQQKYSTLANQANFTMGLGQQRANFGLQAANALSGAGAAMIDTAGAENTAAAIRGQSNAAFGRSLIGAGVGAAGTYFGARAGAKAGVEAVKV